MFREPKQVEVAGKIFTIHKLPAMTGRKIMLRYPVANMPKMGEYAESEELAVQLLSFVTITPQGGNEIALSTIDLINNHVPDAVSVAKLEKEMIQYNFDFLADGEILKALKFIEKVAQDGITGMLTDLLRVLSQKELPRSEN